MAVEHDLCETWSKTPEDRLSCKVAHKSIAVTDRCCIIFLSFNYTCHNVQWLTRVVVVYVVGKTVSKINVCGSCGQ